VPVFDDRKLFEFLLLEGAQAGLSWLTVLKKRENYRKAFSGFDPAKVAGSAKIRYRGFEGPRHHKEPVEDQAAVDNARAF
jgi:DNA-3-methyladenine glycosylase I